VILVAGAVLVATLWQEACFQCVRSRVLAADTAQLEKLGRHFVVGYRDAAELERLIERRAIGACSSAPATSRAVPPRPSARRSTAGRKRAGARGYRRS
jgi:hypothetical protein